MAFWGVEVKPGKSFTLESIEALGIKRLHLSQATLGFGQAVLKSTLQCNLGNKSSIFLFVLTPDKVESCQLNLEFEEAGEVIFSVIGPRSIHLSGYFLSMSPDFWQSSNESEPYGEDINYKDMERSSSDDYDYNDSFINDDDLSGRGSHVPSSDHDEISIKELTAKAKGQGGRLRKKFQTFDETLGRANDGSLKDDFKQVCNIDNDYKIPKVLSSEMPLTPENGKPSSKYEKKTITATVNTSKTVENGDLNENFENKKISEATTYTHMSLDQRECNHKSMGDVELSLIMKGCEILLKSSIVINSKDGEVKHIHESLRNEKPSTDKETKSSSDVFPSPNASLTNQKRKRDMGDETRHVRKNLFECSESKKQAIDKNMEKEDGGGKEPLETEISQIK